MIEIETKIMAGIETLDNRYDEEDSSIPWSAMNSCFDIMLRNYALIRYSIDRISTDTNNMLPIRIANKIKYLKRTTLHDNIYFAVINNYSISIICSQ